MVLDQSHPLRISDRKRWAFRLLALGVPTLVGIVAILGVMYAKGLLVFDEETARPQIQAPPLYLQEPGFELTGHKYLYDDQLGWRNIPSWEATTHDKKLTINSLGFRGRECSTKKADGITRIMVLGDSFAWGYGVADDEVFTTKLEQQLGNRCEVINTGVSGWGTDQQYLFFKNEGCKLDPDVVVVAFFLINDPRNNSFAKQYGLNKPLFLDDELTLVNVPVPKPKAVVTAPEQSEIDPIRLTLAIVNGLADECARIDCPLVLMKFGLYLQPKERSFYKLNQTLATGMRQIANLHYLDLDAEFSRRAFTKQQLIEGNDDGHWNALGHLVTASILENFLATEIQVGR